MARAGVFDPSLVPKAWMALEMKRPAIFSYEMLKKFTETYVLKAEPAVFVLSGKFAALLANRKLPADPGAFAVTGSSGRFERHLLLEAMPGGFSFTGAAAALNKNYLLAANPGAYVVTGSSVGIHKVYTLQANPAAFVVTGFAVQNYIRVYPDPMYVLEGIVYGPNGIYTGTMSPSGIPDSGYRLDIETDRMVKLLNDTLAMSL